MSGQLVLLVRQFRKRLALKEIEASGFGSHNVTQGQSCRALPMRDWIIILAPLAATIYFLVYPDQFKELLAWLTVLVQ